MQKLCVVDVGAANGDFSNFLLSNIQDIQIHAVEPNISINSDSLNLLKDFYDDKFIVHPYALAEESGVREFYGSSQINGQIGSLRKFNVEKKWNRYLDENLDKNELTVAKLIQVKSVSDFLTENKLNRIDFLKIDAQGYDVSLLNEFLKFCKVSCMVLEVNTTSRKSENIYESNNNLDSLIPIICKNELKVIKIVPHYDLSELNIFLAYDFQIGEKIVSNLNLQECPTFSRYWNVIIKDSKTSLLQMEVGILFKKMFSLLFHPIKGIKKISSYYFNELS